MKSVITQLADDPAQRSVMTFAQISLSPASGT
jgi:hypothetical protein